MLTPPPNCVRIPSRARLVQYILFPAKERTGRPGSIHHHQHHRTSSTILKFNRIACRPLNGGALTRHAEQGDDEDAARRRRELRSNRFFPASSHRGVLEYAEARPARSSGRNELLAAKTGLPRLPGQTPVPCPEYARTGADIDGTFLYAALEASSTAGPDTTSNSDCDNHT